LKVDLEKKVLSGTEKVAQETASLLEEKDCFAINVIGSPGAGKTTLIERIIEDWGGKTRIACIVGDLATDRDAKRLAARRVLSVQLNTGKGCHLSAESVAAAVRELPLDELDVVFVENVGNLVCPTAFSLGEALRIIVLSVPEGDDKVSKYLPCFATADIVVISKVDILEHCDFDLDKVTQEILDLRKDMRVFTVSARTGEGIGRLISGLDSRVGETGSDLSSESEGERRSFSLEEGEMDS